MNSTPTRRGADGYASGRATKKSIVASATAAFGEKGFYGTSLRSIAREAGVDHATVLHHFRNKANLLLAVIELHDQQQFRAEFPPRLSAEGLVEAFVNTARRNAETPGLVQLLSTLTAEAGAADHPARETLRRRHDRLIAVLAWTIRLQRGRVAGLDDGTDPNERAALVLAAWDGLQVFDALHPGTLDVPTQVERLLREAFGLP